MILLLLLCISASAQVPKKISYQGVLTTSSGVAVSDGSYNLKFNIYNLPLGGTLRFTKTSSGVNVSRGMFNVILGPLPAIFSESLFVEVTALAGSPGVSTDIVFSPRSELTSVPYALNSVHSDTAEYAKSAPGGGGSYLPLAGGVMTGAITSTGNPEITMGKGNFGTSNTNTGTSAFVAGSGNHSSGDYSTIAGGSDNNANVLYSTISGGRENSVSGASSVVGGGSFNGVAGENSVIVGGEYNTANGTMAVIGGGQNNQAAADYAVVPGGKWNYAYGKYSFAAGRSAKALHDGAFVWGDSTDINFASTAPNQFLIRAGGGVGIGTATPGYALDVNGTINATNIFKNGVPFTTTTADTANYAKKIDSSLSLKIKDLTLFEGSCDVNTIFVDQSPRVSLLSSGSEDLFVGKSAGNSLTCGVWSFNIGIGNRSLFSINSATRNAALGHYSLFNNYDGSYNTSIGNYTLFLNSSGNWNTAIGDAALYNNTADSNTAVGGNALTANTSGKHNTAVGTTALLSNTTGSDNTAVGKDALFSSNGYSNTAIGKEAGTGNLAGSYNVFVGESAGNQNSNGLGNTYLGYRAGAGSSGTYNVFIGSAAGAGVTGNYQLRISSTGNTPLIYGDFATKKVGINTTTPQGALDVSSTTGGFIVPRMNVNERNALTPVNGMIIYNTSTNQFNFYENGLWVTK